MMDLEAPDATILLIHDDELADVREMLDELGLGFEESTPLRTSSEDYRNAKIVISGPRFLLDPAQAGDPGGAVRIAIIESTSKTLRTMLSRSGIEWLVRRPFHPAALRLLLLHCIYQGPEKRSATRVSIGAAIRYQSGWSKRGALLAEISARDCRILAPRPVPVGKPLKLRLPLELAGRPPLVLDGRVVRTAKEGDGAHEVCVLFDPLGLDENRRLKELVEAHSRGPAMLEGSDQRLTRDRPRDPDASAREVRSVIHCGGREPGGEDSEKATVEASEKATVETSEEAAVEAFEKAWIEASEKAAVKTSEKAVVEASEKAAVKTSKKATVETSEEAALETSEKAAVEAFERAWVEASEKAIVETPERAAVETSEGATEERRADPRHAFHRRVIALGEQATRVLVGRDLSLRSMRVDPSPNLRLDQDLQIAIHVPGGDTPLVFDVHVDRDDGERGMVLGFRNLSRSAAAYLEDVLGELPGLQTTSSADGPGVAHVVSEIVTSD